MDVGLFYLPSTGTLDDIRNTKAGLRPELYGQMLREVSAEAKLADELGYDWIAFTEHHFHVEGLEVSNNPVLLDLYIGMQTKRLRVGQLGIVLPVANPLRVAEDIAMLDHMTGGRAIAGFARGYQRRWVDVLGQHLHGVHSVTPDKHDEIDRLNRAAFEENFRIVKKAWTEGLFSFQGEFWKIPPDDVPWTIEATKRYGGGVSNGTVEQIAVVPKPLQKPHPPIYQPFAASKSTIEWCAREDVTAVLAPLRPDVEDEYVRTYADAAGKELGEGIGLRRDLVIADTEEEARQLFRSGAGFFWTEWLRPFGFGRGLVDPKTGEIPDMVDSGYVLVGTVDSVTRTLERLLERVPAKLLVIGIYNSLIPHDRNLRSLEDFATKVLPRVADVKVAEPAAP